MIILNAHAKVNLWLRVLAREESSGYHQIETAFCRLQLSDVLAFERTHGAVELTVEGADLGDPADNLVTRAAVAFRSATGIDPGVRVRLTKNIPAGAGLGGGSSDAAATLVALNRIHSWPLGADALHRLACGLGADVPFFLTGASMALGWGRGDRLLVVPAPVAATVLLVWPGTPIATADAYRALTGRTTGPAPPLALDRLRNWEAIAERAHNDFEAVAPRWLPAFADIRDTLLSGGARFALLAGSGSAVFGLFDARPSAGFVDELQARFPKAVTIETRTVSDPLPGVDPAPRHG